MGATVYYLLVLQKFSKQIQRKYPLCLGNIAKDFTSVNMKKKKKKNGFNRYVSEFSVDCNIIDTSNIVNIHKYLMKKYDIK